MMAARRLRRAGALTLITAGLLGGPAALATPVAHAAVPVQMSLPTGTVGDRMLNAAETRAGDWYQWGAAGPYTFDCSGLIVWAAAREGIWVPHSTYAMLAGTAHLYRIPLSWARRGDLLFYGSGHVEIATIWPRTSFGAHHTGTRVGWVSWNSYYAPTMAMRLR